MDGTVIDPVPEFAVASRVIERIGPTGKIEGCGIRGNVIAPP
jgi:hypothetical protein